jgi:pSer/pThr/pTyr-binding forkhead associated (FHA) protein
VKQITVLFNGRKQVVHLLDEPHVVIGRGRSAHISLDGNPIVSRQHAVVRSELDGHIVEDLGGANGTYLNDALVSQARLRPGDRIVLGKHTLRYEEATPEASSIKREAQPDPQA